MDNRLHQLKALYAECFSDTDACREYLFSKHLGINNVYYSEKDNNIVSALYLVNKQLQYKKTIVTVPFIVALGTIKKYRGQGYARRLIHSVINSLQVPFIMLYSDVENFYEKMGFSFISKDNAYIDTWTKHETKDNILLHNIYQKKCIGQDFYITLSQYDFAEKISITALDGGKYYIIKENDNILGFTNNEETILIGKEETTNGVMGRICSIDKAFAITKSTIPIRIKVVDPLIDNNNSCFTVEKGQLQRCNDFDITISISELTAHFFGYQGRLSKFFSKTKGFISERY